MVLSVHWLQKKWPWNKKVTKSDISIASNGIAGPQNTQYSADESGTVFLSWNIHDKIKKQNDIKLKGEK